MSFLVRLLVNAAALWIATQIVPGVTYTGDVLPLLVVAFVFGVVNATLRPALKILTFPIILLTLGIFALVVNGLMLWLTSAVAGALGIGFHVRGFFSAFVGALVVSIISTVLSLVVGDPKRWRESD
jgi:putative membrane protein